jgi:solute carrier family 50 (sugar transporter)
MASASTILLEYVCPTMGGIVGSYMFFAPFQDVQKALGIGSLGDLNPLPWAFTLGNCIGWVFYAILIGNLFVLVPNMIGLFLSVWFNLAASKLLYQQQFAPIATHSSTDQEDGDDGDDDDENNKPQDASVKPSAPSYDYYVMAMVILWATLIALVGFAKDWSLESKQWIVGISANINLLFFYGAPLSTIATVLQTRNTASIHVLTMITNTANGCFWAAYGFAIFDYLIFVPNGIGALLGFVQFALYITFPRKIISLENNNEPECTKPSKDEEQAVFETSELTAPVDDSENLTCRTLLPTLEEAADP